MFKWLEKNLPKIVMAPAVGLIGWFVYGFVQACIGAVVCFQTIHSYWGSVDGVKTSAEGYIAPAIIAFLNLMVLITGWDLLFKI